MTRLYIIHIEVVIDNDGNHCKIHKTFYKKLSNAVNAVTASKGDYRGIGFWNQVHFTIYELNTRTSRIEEAESQTIFPGQQ